MVPVVEDRRVVGVITRTDLINTLIEEPARIPESMAPEKMRDKNIGSLLRERLPRRVYDLLEMAGQLGGEMNFPVYAVGGFVRDILLRRPNHDLDLVVEGDGIAFARALAERLGGRVRAHTKFKTAVVLFEELRARRAGSGGSAGSAGPAREERVDVATARLEYYEYPAALPTVELSSIKMDLFRRDFTINALAVQLNPGHMGRLVDFFGAQRDIKENLIRVLHSLSFVEDPTRILRAVRFEQRFGFRIGPQTERLVKNAMGLGLIEKLSGSRLFNEMRLIMEEESPLACFRRMERFGLLTAIHPVLGLTKTKELVIEEVERVLDWYRLLYKEPLGRPWMVHFLALCARAKGEETQQLAVRFNFPKRLENDFIALRRDIFSAAQKLVNWSGRKGAPMNRLYEILHPVPVEGVLYLMARSHNEKIRKDISHYLTQLKDVALEISGRDLVERVGMEPGPAVGEILRRTLTARLNGEAPDRKSQLVYAARLAKRVARH
jgi:tRNA nucleotidyltransferase (CCA-adding enzyme)